MIIKYGEFTSSSRRFQMANTWSLGDSVVGEHNKLLHFMSSFLTVFPWPLSDDRSLSFNPTHCICPNAVTSLQQTGSRILLIL